MAEMADGILELASELRRLRLERGAPTYENLARKANVSRSTVADAFSGTKIPSERTLFGIVSALGDAPEPWLVRRAELVAGAQGQVEVSVASASEGPEEPNPTSQPELAESGSREGGLPTLDEVELEPASQEAGQVTLPLPPAGAGAHAQSSSRFLEVDERSPQDHDGGRGPSEAPAPQGAGQGESITHNRARRSVSLALLVPLLVVAALAGAGLSRALWPAQVIEVAAPAQESNLGAGGAEFAVEDGANIWDTGCIYDAIKPGADRAGEFDTQLGLRVSLRCKTIWGVLYRNDGGGFGNQIRLVVYPKTDADPGTPQEILVSDQDYAVTAMILQEDLATDQYCVEAWIIEDGVEISLGEPLCA